MHRVLLVPVLLFWAFGGVSCVTQPEQLSAAQASPDLYPRLDAACGALRIAGFQAGSAFLVSPGGLVMTVAHATCSDAPLTWHSATLGSLPLERVAADPAHDLALLRLPARKGGYPWLALAPHTPASGTVIFNFGNPMLRQRLMAVGMIARDSLAFEYSMDTHSFVEALYVNTTTLHGMSGGPWVNASGEVIGVQSGGIVYHDILSSISWLAPLSAVRALCVSKKSPEVADMGWVADSFFEQDEATSAKFPANSAGAVLVRSEDGLPLQTDGLQPGWLVEAVDGLAINHRDQLLAHVRGKAPGDTVVLRVRPPSEHAREVSVRLGCLQPFKTPAYVSPEPHPLP